jgi:hypothetical protein
MTLPIAVLSAIGLQVSSRLLPRVGARGLLLHALAGTLSVIAAWLATVGIGFVLLIVSSAPGEIVPTFWLWPHLEWFVQYLWPPASLPLLGGGTLAGAAWGIFLRLELRPRS